MRGLDVLDIDLVSILGFMGVDSSTGVNPSTSISSASTLTSISSASPSLIISTFVKASSILTLMDSITVLVLLLKGLYARLVVEYPRKIPSSLFASNFLRFSRLFRI